MTKDTTTGNQVRGVGAVTPNPPELEHAARLVVAAHARDTADARLLLDVLGLAEVANDKRGQDVE